MKRLLLLIFILCCMSRIGYSQVTSSDGTITALNNNSLKLGTSTGTTGNSGTVTTHMTILPTGQVSITGSTTADQFTAVSGYYSTSSNGNLVLRTGTTPRLSILGSNGFVGIGEAAPVEMLHINGNARARIFQSEEGKFNSTGGDLALQTQGTTRFTILSANGFVGIGTAAPTAALEVNGDVRSAGFFSANGVFNSQSSKLSLVTGSAARLTVLGTNGYVGIGTETPAERLHVAGNLLLDNGASPVIYAGASNANAYRFLQVLNSPGQTSVAGVKAGGLLVADDYTYASPAQNDLVVKGRVAIGTPFSQNPENYTLAVNGRIGAKDVKIERTSSTWPDYVFGPRYHLPSLQAVEQYIRQHQHLEGVPSAQEVAAQGQSLADMDVILLKKVEELTLYIIEQQKQIDALKKQLEENKKQ